MGAIEIKRGDNRVEIVLSSELDISQAIVLKETLNEALDAHVPLALAIDAIERIDTAALQVLVAFYGAASRQGIPVECSTASSKFERALRLLGLSEIIELAS